MPVPSRTYGTSTHSSVCELSMRIDPLAIMLAPGSPQEQWPSDTTSPARGMSGPLLTSVTLKRSGAPPSLIAVSPSGATVTSTVSGLGADFDTAGGVDE